MLNFQVWDIRSKMQIHALSGHDNTVCSVFTRPTVCRLFCCLYHFFLDIQLCHNIAQSIYMHLSSDILISVRLVCRLSDLFSPLLFNMINVKTDCHFKCSFETCHNLFYFFKPLFPCSYFVYRIPKLLRVLMTLPSRCGTLDMVIYGFVFPIFLLVYVVIICII